jgi:demethylmenaquinone methyltransferase/2-methoxy-6-polyprenyl-1,4-benzoquinol methylase
MEICINEKDLRVLRHFNAVAKQYDLMNTLLSFGIHHLWKRTAVNLLKLKPGDRVLDLCGGTGDLAILAQKKIAPGGKAVLYDINREMMEAGRQAKHHAEIRQHIDYVQGNAEILAFPDQSFDAVMVGFGVRNLSRMDLGFQEMYRVLKPDGRMMCLEFSEPINPIFRKLYDLYSLHVMPRLGEMIAGSRQAYTYLPESIRLFPSPDKLRAMLEHIGFSEVRYRRLTNGIAVIHIGVKDA